jgi:hypothetical protein
VRLARTRSSTHLVNQYFKTNNFIVRFLVKKFLGSKKKDVVELVSRKVISSPQTMGLPSAAPCASASRTGRIQQEPDQTSRWSNSRGKACGATRLAHGNRRHRGSVTTVTGSPEGIDYKIQKTPRGIWKSFVYPTGHDYLEFTSHATLFGLPVLHVTVGVNPETGRRKVARGVIGIGRIASGIIAIGQLAYGVIGIGHLGMGLLGIGQGAIGLMAIGQLAIGPVLAMGQIAVGLIAIGQLAVGRMVLAQVGYGQHVWSAYSKDPMAIDFFKALDRWLVGR